ncbi:MAG: hypothetical protein QXT14_03035 [Candidatus Bathyarchaeia archaeon]
MSFDKLCELWKRGATLRELAIMLHTNHQTSVLRKLRRMNAPVKGRNPWLNGWLYCAREERYIHSTVAVRRTVKNGSTILLCPNCGGRLRTRLFSFHDEKRKV